METPRTTGLSGTALKWAAIVTMLVDHIGGTLLLSLYYQQMNEMSRGIYYAARVVGRVAFPIFCFLLVEGFAHTRSRGKYALRLGAFALVSEIPFDIAFNRPENGFLELDSQNVFFTLLLGLLALWLWAALAERVPQGWGYLTLLPAALPCYLAAEALKTDYASFGVLLIVALGAGRGLPGQEPARRNRILQLIMGSAAILYYCSSRGRWIEVYAILGLAACLRYNGERGRGGKWFFYVFYPAHLLVLGLVNRALF